MVNLLNNIYLEIKSQVKENNLDERYVDVVAERLDNDDYLFEQIKTAIDYAIEAETDYANSIKE
jgi:hypothetical protein